MAESLGSVTISISEYDKLRQSQKIVDGELFIKTNDIGQILGIYSTSDELIKLAQKNKELTKNSKEARFKVLDIQAQLNTANYTIKKQEEEIKELKEGPEINRLKDELAACELDLEIAKIDNDYKDKLIALLRTMIDRYNIFDFMKFRKLVKSGHNYLAAHESIIISKDIK